MCGFCNVWFCNVWLCVSVDFEMFECVYVWVFNVCVCECNFVCVSVFCNVCFCVYV